MRISSLVVPALAAVLGASTASVQKAEAAPLGPNLASTVTQSSIMPAGYDGDGYGYHGCHRPYYGYYHQRSYYPHHYYNNYYNSYSYNYYNYDQPYYRHDYYPRHHYHRDYCCDYH